jgi:hypothetical protein
MHTPPIRCLHPHARDQSAVALGNHYCLTQRSALELSDLFYAMETLEVRDGLMESRGEPLTSENI